MPKKKPLISPFYPIDNDMDVYRSDDDIQRIVARDLEWLMKALESSEGGRVRICMHSSNTDLTHEMIIALASSTYVQPHRHMGKSESFHVIEGNLDVVIFNEDGTIADIVQMGPPSSERTFYYRLNKSLFHTVLIRTPHAIIHETTTGPFNPADVQFATWAPAGETAENYMQNLENLMSKFQRSQPAPSTTEHAES